MNKRMKIMLIGVAILFGLIFGYKLFTNIMMKHYFASHSNPAITVSTAKANYQVWQPELKAVGSLRAIKGVNVTTEVGGMVQKIYFTPGAQVKEGDVLVQLNADTDIAQLHSLQANAELAKTVYVRDKAQYAIRAISKAQLDTDAANLKSQNAQVAQQQATVIKKTIQAPFTGRLGISAVNPGQYLNPGNKIVSLQTYDPIYVDFYVPQQELTTLKIGQDVNLVNNLAPKNAYTGKITTIDSAVDSNTRNVEIEATIANPKAELNPGMFADVKVTTGQPMSYMTVPQTAVTFNSYGNVIYVIKHDPKNKDQLIAQQTFVVTGESRGDQIQILNGLQKGDEVITSGQVKLKNNSPVLINNSVRPADNPNPQPIDE